MARWVDGPRLGEKGWGGVDRLFVLCLVLPDAANRGSDTALLCMWRKKTLLLLFVASPSIERLGCVKVNIRRRRKRGGVQTPPTTPTRGLSRTCTPLQEWRGCSIMKACVKCGWFVFLFASASLSPTRSFLGRRDRVERGRKEEERGRMGHTLSLNGEERRKEREEKTT